MAKATVKGVIKRAKRIQSKTGASNKEALSLGIKRAVAYQGRSKTRPVAATKPTKKPTATTMMSQQTIDVMRGRGTGRNRSA